MSVFIKVKCFISHTMAVGSEVMIMAYSRFSHDVTKIQTKKLLLLLSFYFHVILKHLKAFLQTNFRFKRVICFAIRDA